MYMSDDDDDNAPIQRGPKVFRPRITFEVPNDFQFKEKFRLRRGEVDTVLGRIAPYLLNSEKNMALTPMQQLLVALHFLGNGGAYHGVSDMHGVSKSTVCRVVNRVVNSIVEHLFQDVVRWPDDKSNLAADFMQKGGFPSVCGCIDGSLIPIQSPSINEEQYVDHNGHHSINMLAVCGPDRNFYFVSSRWPGATHDARVLRRSFLSDRFTAGWRPFPGAVLLGMIMYHCFFMK
jgi:hypothetical protein